MKFIYELKVILIVINKLITDEILAKGRKKKIKSQFLMLIDKVVLIYLVCSIENFLSKYSIVAIFFANSKILELLNANLAKVSSANLAHILLSSNALF